MRLPNHPQIQLPAARSDWMWRAVLAPVRRSPPEYRPAPAAGQSGASCVSWQFAWAAIITDERVSASACEGFRSIRIKTDYLQNIPAGSVLQGKNPVKKFVWY